MKLNQTELQKYLGELLRAYEYDDYGPNGLQIEANDPCAPITKIAFAVSATRDSIEKCVEQGAQALIVHHGLFWKFHGPKTITGPFAKRVKPLIQNNIALFGYHLPLDGHPEVGNAASIAKELGLEELAPFGMRGLLPTGIKGKFKTPLAAHELKTKIENLLSHKALHAIGEKKLISSMGIITGGANSEWKEALKAGLDSYLTGEMSEHDWNEASEAGVHMFAAGHHATEKLGIQALMRNIAQSFQVETLFIDSENPA